MKPPHVIQCPRCQTALTASEVISLHAAVRASLRKPGGRQKGSKDLKPRKPRKDHETAEGRKRTADRLVQARARALEKRGTWLKKKKEGK